MCQTISSAKLPMLIVAFYSLLFADKDHADIVYVDAITFVKGHKFVGLLRVHERAVDASSGPQQLRRPNDTRIEYAAARHCLAQ